jgi:hypothetical protein
LEETTALLNAPELFPSVKKQLDTTSVSGYRNCGPADPPFQITCVHSKAHHQECKKLVLKIRFT